MLRSKWMVLTLIWLSLFVAYIDRVNLSFAGPAMMTAFHFGPAAFGIALSAFSIGYAAMQIPGGALADRFGAREVLIGAMLLWSICTGAVGLVYSLGSLIAARVALGAGEGMENGAQFKLLGSAFSSKERSSATGFFLTALAVAPACTAPLAILILQHFGWRALFLLCAIPGPIVALLIYRLLPKTDRRATSPAEGATRVAWSDVVFRGRTWLVGLAYLGFNMTFWSLLGWLPTYLTHERHLETGTLAWATSMTYVAGFFGLLAVGWLGARFLAHRAAIVAGSYALAACALYLAYATTDPRVSVAGFACSAFFLYGGFGPLWAIVLDAAPPALHGIVSGFVNFCGQLGSIVAPAAFGLIVQATHSYGGGFGLMIAGLAIAIVALLVPRNPLPGSIEPGVYV